MSSCAPQVGALGKAKEVLREVVQLPLQQPALFAQGSLARPTKGILLFGPPGMRPRQATRPLRPRRAGVKLTQSCDCSMLSMATYYRKAGDCMLTVMQEMTCRCAGTGKTLLAKATAAECGASFLAISPSVLMSKWVGESVRVVRACFSLAAKLAPCVLFLDEVSLSCAALRPIAEHSCCDHSCTLLRAVCQADIHLAFSASAILAPHLLSKRQSQV